MSTHTAAVHAGFLGFVFFFFWLLLLFPADSISISLLLHGDSVPRSVIHTIRLKENSATVDSVSLRCLWVLNVYPDGFFPKLTFFKVAEQFNSILIHCFT